MPLAIPFVKAHACGNDFLIVDESFAGGSRAVTARRLCDRNTGIGADGVEWVDLCGDKVTAILSNADGSIAEISGNGTRCVAAWVAAEQKRNVVEVHTGAGKKTCRVLSHEDKLFQVETAMGKPLVEPLAVEQHIGFRVSLGNPHFVLFVAHIPPDWIQIGASLATHPAFPEGTNVEFVKILGPDTIEFRIYERGAGPTLSSGTGSCASAVAAISAQGVASPVHVISQGGAQLVRWQDEVFLTGPAQLVASGEAYL